MFWTYDRVTGMTPRTTVSPDGLARWSLPPLRRTPPLQLRPQESSTSALETSIATIKPATSTISSSKTWTMTKPSEESVPCNSNTSATTTSITTWPSRIDLKGCIGKSASKHSELQTTLAPMRCSQTIGYFRSHVMSTIACLINLFQRRCVCCRRHTCQKRVAKEQRHGDWERRADGRCGAILVWATEILVSF